MKDNLVYGILMVFGMDALLKVLGSLEMDIVKKLQENGTALSRKRRYLVFPEGSSFQVVFDLTYPSVGMGNAFVFGNTAAMGFELPYKPIFLDEKKMSKEEEKPENKTTTKVPANLERPLDYQEDWQPAMPHDIPENSQEWQHPDDSVPNLDSSYDSAWTNIDRSPVTFYSHPFQEHVNRRLPSVGEYGNLYNPSTFWNPEGGYQNNRLSKDGKACILKTICQVNKIPKSKGSMWEEILKAIFKVKPHGFYPDEDHYDEAADLKHDCTKMYPECDGHVLGKLFRKKNN